MSNQIIIQDEAVFIKDKIFIIRDHPVMLDRDLAELYGVETKVFNQAVKRNIARFPQDFRFQLDDNEKNELVTNCDRLQKLKHSTVNPYVFTEQGVSMLSAILKSDIAVDISIKIVRAFVHMRKFISSNDLLFNKIEYMEKKLLNHDEKFNKLFDAIEDKTITKKQGIFFNGQIFDAYVFMSSLMKEAKKSVVLIDNYVDETTLVHLSSKSAKGVRISILTDRISKALRLDVKKHNEQYTPIELHTFKHSHDRFLFIDEKIYHLGASLKDLGKKWFAFSLIEEDVFVLKKKIGEVLDAK